MKKTFTLFLLISALCFGNCYAQCNLDSGLVAKYPFSGNALDASGNGNNGIVVNATLTSDRFSMNNNAYLFNGNPTSCYIDLGALPGLNNAGAMSISIWVFKYYDDRYEGFIGKWLSTPFVNNNTFLLNNGISNNLDHVTFFVNFSDNTGRTVSGTTAISKDKWFHLVCTFDNITGTLSLYEDGLLANSVTNAADIGKELKSHTAYTAKIGNFGYLSTGSTYDFIGKLDDIRIYNRVLTTTEIDSLYAEPFSSIDEANASPEDGLVFYPNPASDQLTVLTDQPCTLELLNMSGQVCERLQISEFSTSVDLTRLAPGLYVLRNCTASSVTTRKLMVE